MCSTARVLLLALPLALPRIPIARARRSDCVSASTNRLSGRLDISAVGAPQSRAATVPRHGDILSLPLAEDTTPHRRAQARHHTEHSTSKEGPL